jgi:hypothetical protein
MKKLFFFYFIFQFFVIIPGMAAFPEWLTPNKAKLLAVEEFIRNAKNYSLTFYRINEIKYKKEVMENGTEIIYIDILFSTPTCKNEASTEFWDYRCDKQSCTNFPLVVGECVPDPNKGF